MLCISEQYMYIHIHTHFLYICYIVAIWLVHFCYIVTGYAPHLLCGKRMRRHGAGNLTSQFPGHRTSTGCPTGGMNIAKSATTVSRTGSFRKPSRTSSCAAGARPLFVSTATKSTTSASFRCTSPRQIKRSSYAETAMALGLPEELTSQIIYTYVAYCPLSLPDARRVPSSWKGSGSMPGVLR